MKGSDKFLGLTLWLTQGFMDELSCRIKELRDIESRFVISLHAKVVDVQVAVVIGTGQHIVPLSLRCVENVRHPQFLQVWSLQRRFPAKLVLSFHHHQPLSLLDSFHSFMSSFTYSSPIYTLGQTRSKCVYAAPEPLQNSCSRSNVPGVM